MKESNEGCCSPTIVILQMSAMLFHHEQISRDSRASKYYTVRRLLLGKKTRLIVSHGHWCASTVIIAVELAMKYSL